jgi:hypothetical protein
MRIYLCLLLAAASTVQAGTNAATPNTSMAPANTLPVETITAIQRISQNILQAKIMGRRETGTNAEQLALLNGALSQLIAVERQSLPANPVGLPGTSFVTPATQPATGLVARMAAQNQAWDVIDALRQSANQLQGQHNAPAQAQVYSGGFSVGAQRGRLFVRWADKLEVALDNQTPDRLAQLTALQTQLTPQATAGIYSSNRPKTPSLQNVIRPLPMPTMTAIKP